MAQSKLQILIETNYKGKAAKLARQEMIALEKQTKKSSSGLDSMKTGFKMLGVAALGVGGALFAAKKAFDLGAEGAKVKQLGESFDLMNESVWKTPNLLKDMQEATRNTVSETQLMSGILTLSAGATDTLASKLAAAAPRLAEIAKAANKLNPTLGTTGFMFESIATGVKRASPMILDNLGIMVKIGPANERYAESLGKTVEQLTAEEKQLALLNEVMESGGRLIKQVGGDVGSAGDAYEETAAEIANMTAEFKMLASEMIGPVAKAFGGLLGDLRLFRERKKELQAISLMGKDAGLSADRLDFLRVAINKLINDGKYMVVQAEDLERANKLLDKSIILQTRDWSLSADAAVAMADATIKTTEATKGAMQVSERERAALKDTEQAVGFVLEKIKDMPGAYDDMIGPTRAATGAYDDQTHAAENTAWAMEIYGKKALEASDIEEAAKKVTDELAAAWRAAGKAARGAFGGTTLSALDALVTAEEEGTPVANDFFDALFRASAAAGAPTSALQGLADMTENYTDAQIRAALRTAATQTKIQDLAQDVADGVITWIEAKDELNNYIDGLDRVPTEVHTDFTWNFKGPPAPDFYRTGGIGTGGAPGEKRIGGVQKQHGGDFIVPPGYNGDKFPVWTSSGERVIVQTKEQQKAGGGGNNITINLGGGSGGGLVDAHRIAGAVADVIGARG